MARKMRLFQRLLPFAILLLLCAVIAPARADHSFDIDPNPSPEASTSLICPGDDPLDCYPSLFQPTIYFQKIRPNQSIPPGLHVRLNIQTGEKEARLNVPEESGEESGGHKPEALVIIDDVPPTSETALGIIDEEDSALHLRLQDASNQAKHAKPYAPPRSAAPADIESRSYRAALNTMTQNGLTTGSDFIFFDSDMADAYETLTELAHSMEWGLTICRNADLVVPLLNSIFYAKADREPKPRSAGMLLLGTAIQNNPDALKALVNSAGKLLLGTAIQNNPDAMKALLNSEDQLRFGRDFVLRLLRSLERDCLWAEEGQEYTNLLSREIFFLSQICAPEEMAHHYMSLTHNEFWDLEAFQPLWGLFEASVVKETGSRMKLKHRIANFVEDHVKLFAATRVELSKGDLNEMLLSKLRLRGSLQPWCRALHSHALTYGKDDSFGFFQAEQEVSRVLELHTVEGCIFTGEDEWQKEL